MPGRLLLTASLLLAVATPAVAMPAAPAEPEPGQLVVEGQGNSSTELVLDREVLLRGEPPVLSGEGDYVGVLIEPTAPDTRTPPVVGGLQVRAFADGTESATAVLGLAGRLPAGRYRVTLLGDGAVRAELALSDRGAPGLVVVPRDAVPVRFSHRAEALAPGLSTAAVDLDGALPPGRRALQVALLRDTGGDVLRMCATTAARCEAPLPERLTAAPPGGASAVAELVAAAPERRSLRWATTGVRPAPDRLRAAVLVL